MSSEFPILRVPQVVFCEILDSADPHEIFAIALCSKRAYSLVKKYARKLKKMKLRMNARYHRAIIHYQNTRFQIFNSIFCFEQFLEDPLKMTENVNIKGNRVELAKSGKEERYFNILWNEDREYGFRILIEWLQDLLRTEIAAIVYDSNTLWTLEWVLNRQALVKIVNFYEDGETITDENLLNLLDHCDAEDLIITTTPSESFQYPGAFKRRACLSVLRDAFWITLDHLLTMDFIELRVSGSKLTNSDINLFLKHWLAGGSPRLKWLRINFEDFGLGDPFEDLHHLFQYEPPENQVPIEYHTYVGNVVPFQKGRFIQRDDGIIAMINRNFDEKILRLVIWPDSQNNSY